MKWNVPGKAWFLQGTDKIMFYFTQTSRALKKIESPDMSSIARESRPGHELERVFADLRKFRGLGETFRINYGIISRYDETFGGGQAQCHEGIS